jgi:hypothetical protein
MSVLPTQESGQTGNQDLPTPEFSDQPGASSTSADADAIVSKLLPQLEQLIERKVQSTKDKRISQIEKALGGRLDLLAELEEQGVSIPKDVRTEMQIRELQERINQPASEQPAPARDTGLSHPKQAVTDAITELQKYELDTNDAAFIELLRGKYANREAFDLKVQQHIVSKLKPQKPASIADVVQAPAKGGAAGNKEETSVLVDKLAQYQKFPSKYKAEIEATKKELEARDWK